MLSRRRTQFEESLRMNSRSYRMYYNRLFELALARFEWENLPDTVDPRFLEVALFTQGQAVFFEDPVIGFLSLRCLANGNFDVYGIPYRRTAVGYNDYRMNLTAENSVIIFNNLLHSNSMWYIENFAQQLYTLDRAIAVNANAQKTPILLECEDSQRLTMENLFKEYDGNCPVIFTRKGFDKGNFGYLSTMAPYTGDKLYTLKQKIWNEALTFLGIYNSSADKKERMIVDELMVNQGDTMSYRDGFLKARNQAAKQINEMFGLNISCKYVENAVENNMERREASGEVYDTDQDDL